jgi:predicted nucleic acid-binding protein
MATYYADTSVLVKRHVPEIGSAWVRALANAAPPNVIITAQLSLVELYSALNRRVRAGTVTPPQYQRSFQSSTLFGRRNTKSLT